MKGFCFGRYALTTGLDVAMFAGCSAPQLRTVPLGVTSNARPDWPYRVLAPNGAVEFVYAANNDSENVSAYSISKAGALTQVKGLAVRRGSRARNCGSRSRGKVCLRDQQWVR